MPETFGARLRQHREGQGILLITIAEQTKIKMSLLEAVERDDVSQWPSGIFRRAFIRAYAHAIGLDPDVVVREFLETHPEPAEVAAAALAAAAAADTARPNSGPPMRLRSLVGSALGSLSLRLRGASVEDSAAAAAVPPPQVDPAPTASALPPPRPDRGAAVPAQDLPIDLPARGAASEVALRNEPAATARATVAPAADHRPAVTEPPPPPPDPGPAAPAQDAAVEVALQNVHAAFEPDLLAVANVCTGFGRVQTTEDVQSLLEESANILEAIGLIVWIWDGMAAELRPALVHGYSDRVLAQLPPVRRDADNATAAAFRSATARVIEGSRHTSGALVIPLLTSGGCAGVLALEFPNGRQSVRAVQAVATIFAALLAQLLGDRPEETAQEADRVAPPIDTFAGSPLRLTPAAR